MPRIVYVTPKHGRRVLDPATLKPIPAHGMAVESTSYWQRRKMDGDVELSEAIPSVPPVADTHTDMTEADTGKAGKRK